MHQNAQKAATGLDGIGVARPLRLRGQNVHSPKIFPKIPQIVIQFREIYSIYRNLLNLPKFTQNFQKFTQNFPKFTPKFPTSCRSVGSNSVTLSLCECGGGVWGGGEEKNSYKCISNTYKLFN